MKLDETQQQQKTTEQQLHTITMECEQLRAELEHNKEQYRVKQHRLQDSLKEAQNKIKSLEKRACYWPLDDEESSTSFKSRHEHESPSVISPVSNQER
jgi:chromosome segregation ATPase